MQCLLKCLNGCHERYVQEGHDCEEVTGREKFPKVFMGKQYAKDIVTDDTQEFHGALQIKAVRILSGHSEVMEVEWISATAYQVSTK
ncbi:hypothetical protein C5167_007792 [Papaver somniferum]|nr:hypothetical protein C5167_007792 [Papaver somniferum]